MSVEPAVSSNTVVLAKGELEDELPRDQAIAVLNHIYPKGQEISSSDLDPGKPFVREANRALWQKKQVEFDKVKFAAAMAASIRVDDTPSTLLEAIKGARLRALALSTRRT